MEIILESLIRPPEFEQRCDDFIDEVLEKVAQKYPDLEIYVRNATKYTIDVLPKQIAILRQLATGKKLEILIEAHRRLAEKDEILSAQQNTAEVNIWGNEGSISRNQVEKAINEVWNISFQYEPTIVHQDIDLEDPDFPNAHLFFTFAAHESTGRE